MPAKSRAQATAARMALAAKRGDIPVNRLRGAAKDMYESMSKDELKKFAHTETSKLPKHGEKKKK